MTWAAPPGCPPPTRARQRSTSTGRAGRGRAGRSRMLLVRTSSSHQGSGLLERESGQLAQSPVQKRLNVWFSTRCSHSATESAAVVGAPGRPRPPAGPATCWPPTARHQMRLPARKSTSFARFGGEAPRALPPGSPRRRSDRPSNSREWERIVDLLDPGVRSRQLAPDLGGQVHGRGRPAGRRGGDCVARVSACTVMRSRGAENQSNRSKRSWAGPAKTSVELAFPLGRDRATQPDHGLFRRGQQVEGDRVQQREQVVQGPGLSGHDAVGGGRAETRTGHCLGVVQGLPRGEHTSPEAGLRPRVADPRCGGQGCHGGAHRTRQVPGVVPVLGDGEGGRVGRQHARVVPAAPRPTAGATNDARPARRPVGGVAEQGVPERHGVGRVVGDEDAGPDCLGQSDVELVRRSRRRPARGG